MDSEKKSIEKKEDNSDTQGLPQLDSHIVDDYDRDNQDTLENTKSDDIENDQQKGDHKIWFVAAAVVIVGLILFYSASHYLKNEELINRSTVINQLESTSDSGSKEELINILNNEISEAEDTYSQSLSVEEEPKNNDKTIYLIDERIRELVNSISYLTGKIQDMDKRLIDSNENISAIKNHILTIENKLDANEKKNSKKLKKKINIPTYPAWMKNASILSIRRTGDNFIAKILVNNQEIKLRSGEKYRNWTASINTTDVVFRRSGRSRTLSVR